ncbi:hypothetical protein DRP53_03055 [candidate division WOR-3 bacterium]|uniref:Uncharacterized protein n=1 Tax=candidate division WOR-3 bacterium TaxID=2052148 RepID=A0A660SJQ8_UNCW3|nr:MAG: hypothetical protein DRP53_03055 [candidate division WOR-3 bacterium]
MRRYLPILYGIFFLIGCKGAVELTAPDVTYEVTSDGGGLSLSWSEQEDAEGYIIYADDVVVDTVTDLSYEMKTPAKVVKVTAYAGEEESDPWTHDFSPVISTGVSVWGLADPDPDHPSGLGFDTEGNAVTYALLDTANWNNIDFVFDDKNFTTINIVTPNSSLYNSGQGINDESNYTSDEQQVSFDSLDIAPAAGSYYDHSELVVNGVFASWIDPDGGASPDANDNFIKFQVVKISGHEVQLKIAYQREGGLRWLVTR